MSDIAGTVFTEQEPCGISLLRKKTHLPRHPARGQQAGLGRSPGETASTLVQMISLFKHGRVHFSALCAGRKTSGEGSRRPPKGKGGRPSERRAWPMPPHGSARRTHAHTRNSPSGGLGLLPRQPGPSPKGVEGGFFFRLGGRNVAALLSAV